jgi:hypothetical protein
MKPVPSMAIFGFLSLTLVSCLDLGQCGNQVKTELISPDQLIVARVLERNCGATTGFTTVISIQSKSEPFDSENVDSQDIALIVDGQYKIQLRWINANHLAVKLPAKLAREDMLSRSVLLRGTKITYSR